VIKNTAKYNGGGIFWPHSKPLFINTNIT
jgi:hypothetical protein